MTRLKVIWKALSSPARYRLWVLSLQQRQTFNYPCITIPGGAMLQPNNAQEWEREKYEKNRILMSCCYCIFYSLIIILLSCPTFLSICACDAATAAVACTLYHHHRCLKLFLYSNSGLHQHHLACCCIYNKYVSGAQVMCLCERLFAWDAKFLPICYVFASTPVSFLNN